MSLRRGTKSWETPSDADGKIRKLSVPSRKSVPVDQKFHCNHMHMCSVSACSITCGILCILKMEQSSGSNYTRAGNYVLICSRITKKVMRGKIEYLSVRQFVYVRAENAREK